MDAASISPASFSTVTNTTVCTRRSLYTARCGQHSLSETRMQSTIPAGAASTLHVHAGAWRRGTARRFMGEACDCTVCSELFVLLLSGLSADGPAQRPRAAVEARAPPPSHAAARFPAQPVRATAPRPQPTSQRSVSACSHSAPDLRTSNSRFNVAVSGGGASPAESGALRVSAYLRSALWEAADNTPVERISIRRAMAGARVLADVVT